MPRENRKRGKKHKKSAEQEPAQDFVPQQEVEPTPEAGPSWISRAPANCEEDREAPFGYVDAEVKAYFRTVDVQIREWQEEQAVPEAEDDSDPNEDRRLFFVAALNEMSGKEKQLATDPDCSGILERMAYSMDDFARRVFIDRLSGSYEQLLKHRFASHVCQTLLTVAGDTITRECRGILPSAHDSEDSDDLRTLTQLVLDICEEITPTFSSLVLDPFASHVVRALLSLLIPELANHTNANGPSTIRSKKSAAYKAKQGPLKSVFTSLDRDTNVTGPVARPDGFSAAARRFVMDLRDKLDGNEVRALAANQVASPVLQLLLEVEARQQMSDEPGSLMDSVLTGMITTLHEDDEAKPEASDYVGTLLRDPTSSHLLETLVSRSPGKVFNVLWATYFQGKLPRLAVHPVANFVVAKAIMRLSAAQLSDACQELDGVTGKILKSARIGVFRAMVDRASELRQQESIVLEAICNAFGLQNIADRANLVPCVLRLLPLQDFKALPSESHDSNRHGHEHRSKKQTEDPSEPKTQGAVLLQTMLSLPSPHNQIIIDSVFSQSMDDLLAMSRHVTSSRVFDALLDSTAVPLKAKRQFILKFMGHFHTLADDRIGSRVADRCWASADPYLKEKIARSLIYHEQTLAASFYGKFFARRLNLNLLRRDTEKWKNLQITSKPNPPPPPPAAPAPAPVPEPSSTVDPPADVSPRKSGKRKRREQPEDEIDQLFSTALGKKTKKAELSSEHAAEKPAPEKESKSTKAEKGAGRDRVMEDVLGAIKTAPKSEVRSSKKKRLK
ncbi:ARM repeat-containing protein [Cristinia sonorae]|uniref:Nucleolar protein 9 n=1 Tax=Cristinia sonorae TaxID=1940300 RepID=A0A8K0UWK8_9AGAR|nr:ARM repeat-containing protein [Cristinia sonorae]